ncbi:MAG: hypothetical protein ACF8LL_08710, partial [Phycisphaerales bacterium]
LAYLVEEGLIGPITTDHGIESRTLDREVAHLVVVGEDRGVAEALLERGVLGVELLQLLQNPLGDRDHGDTISGRGVDRV